MGHDFHTYVKLPEGILIDSISHVYRFVPYSVVKSAMFDGCTVVPYYIYIYTFICIPSGNQIWQSWQLQITHL